MLCVNGHELVGDTGHCAEGHAAAPLNPQQVLNITAGQLNQIIYAAVAAAGGATGGAANTGDNAQRIESENSSKLTGENRTVWVGNVSDGITDETIRKEFSSCGKVLRITRSDRGFCHIQFQRQQEAEEAIREKDRLWWKPLDDIPGRFLRVEPAMIRKMNRAEARTNWHRFCIDHYVCENFNIYSCKNAIPGSSCPNGHHVCFYCLAQGLGHLNHRNVDPSCPSRQPGWQERQRFQSASDRHRFERGGGIGGGRGRGESLDRGGGRGGVMGGGGRGGSLDRGGGRGGVMGGGGGGRSLDLGGGRDQPVTSDNQHPSATITQHPSATITQHPSAAGDQRATFQPMLLNSSQIHVVKLAACHGVDNFFVKPVSSSAQLLALMQKIGRKDKLQPISSTDIKCGMSCLALAATEIVYRAIVLNFVELNTKVETFFIDIGIVQTLPLDRIFRISEEDILPRAFAFRCRLNLPQLSKSQISLSQKYLKSFSSQQLRMKLLEPSLSGRGSSLPKPVTLQDKDNNDVGDVIQEWLNQAAAGGVMNKAAGGGVVNQAAGGGGAVFKFKHSGVQQTGDDQQAKGGGTKRKESPAKNDSNETLQQSDKTRGSRLVEKTFCLPHYLYRKLSPRSKQNSFLTSGPKRQKTSGQMEKQMENFHNMSQFSYQMAIPSNRIRDIEGERGESIAEIRRQSLASVTFDENVGREGFVVITLRGTQEAISKARNMIENTLGDY